MSKNAADDSVLGALHSAVAQALTSAVKGERVMYDKEGNAIQMPPTAAELAAAISFLKNNNITCVPSDDNALGQLQKALEAKQNRRKPELPDADEGMQFGRLQ